MSHEALRDIRLALSALDHAINAMASVDDLSSFAIDQTHHAREVLQTVEEDMAGRTEPRARCRRRGLSSPEPLPEEL